MQTESKSIKETLEPILNVLSDLGGKFTFMDDEGREFVLASREALELEHAAMHQYEEEQLELLDMNTMADAIRRNIDVEIGDDVIERINRDIALTHSQELLDDADEDEITEISLEEDEPAQPVEQDDVPDWNPPMPPRIRFESVRGDLPPQLQE